VEPTGRPRLAPWLFAAFFASGAAALVYQVAWQRALFTIFGINIESVTLVVTAFLLGLGAGSLAGGALSRDPARRVLLWFAGIEGAIGAFGLVSLRVFAAAGSATLAAPAAVASLAVFLLVLVPTTLMGATLPLLVSHAVRASGNVGRSVGALYSVNTVGSALAALASALFLMAALGLQGSVAVAAALNGAVAVTALVLGRRA
jgi:predicted membrane-bound spermidine synthase